MIKLYGSTFRGVAQLVEQRSPKPRVVGSSPATPAKFELKSAIAAFFLLCFINNSASARENATLADFIFELLHGLI